MKQTLTHKNLRRLLIQTKSGTCKRLYYGLLLIGTMGYCSKCNKMHAGKCTIRRLK